MRKTQRFWTGFIGVMGLLSLMVAGCGGGKGLTSEVASLAASEGSASAKLARTKKKKKKKQASNSSSSSNATTPSGGFFDSPVSVPSGPAGMIIGRILRNGVPVAGKLVTADTGQFTTTRSNGTFQLTGLSIGTLTLTVGSANDTEVVQSIGTVLYNQDTRFLRNTIAVSLTEEEQTLDLGDIGIGTGRGVAPPIPGGGDVNPPAPPFP